MMRIFVTGGSGLIGRKLIEALIKDGHEITVLTRSARQTRTKFEEKVRIIEDSVTDSAGFGQEANNALDGCDAVINLAGAPIFEGRWTKKAKARFRESRINTTENLVTAIAKAKHKPKVMVSTSAVGYYGDDPSKTMNENAPPGNDFLAHLCVDWEASAKKLESLGVRLVIVRIGLVLHGSGGALPRLLPLFKFGLGDRLGSGEQWVSWVHLDDVIGIYRQALKNDQAKGIFNATAPHPQQNRNFFHSFSTVLGRKSILHVPAFLLKTALGEASNALLLGQRVIPFRAKNLGYDFKYPTIQSALSEILAKPLEKRNISKFKSRF